MCIRDSYSDAISTTKLALLLTVLAASGCGLPSRTSNALQSVTRTAPATDGADSAAQNRDLLAGLRVGAGDSGYLPVSEMQAPATLMPRRDNDVRCCQVLLD